MEDRTDCDHLLVAIDALYLPHLRREQPGSHGVIEEKLLRELLGIFDHIRDQRRVRHTDSRYQTCPRRDHCDSPFDVMIAGAMAFKSEIRPNYNLWVPLPLAFTSIEG